MARGAHLARVLARGKFMRALHQQPVSGWGASRQTVY
jgi:hypothetical protein